MLPFLKKSRLPRINNSPQTDKLINASPEDLIDDRCMDELFKACEDKDFTKFRSALEALVMNMFESGEENE